MSFVEGWESKFFISKWCMQQLLLECPSIYELLANPNFQWKDTPLLQIWRENLDNDGKKSALLESYEPAEAIKMIEKALSNNEVSHSHSNYGITQLTLMLIFSENFVMADHC
jgi:hypothetical protein